MYGILSQCDYKDDVTGRQCQRFMPHVGYSHDLLSLKTIIETDYSIEWTCPVCISRYIFIPKTTRNWEERFEWNIEQHEARFHGIMTEGVKFHDDIRRLDSQLQEAFINPFRK